MLQNMDSKKIIQRLEREGWYKAHQVGSHIKFRHADKPGFVTVPHPKKDMPAGTLKSIFVQAGWDWK
jgi:predicted RNA binding protein YcfA (HicA-like mRNA interferase family)